MTKNSTSPWEISLAVLNKTYETFHNRPTFKLDHMGSLEELIEELLGESSTTIDRWLMCHRRRKVKCGGIGWSGRILDLNL